MQKHKNTIAILLLVWFIANFIPHIIVFLVSGKIYYQLTPVWGLAVESSIMLLNLLLPVIFYVTSHIKKNTFFRIWVGDGVDGERYG